MSDPSVRITDPHRIRALAHPVRLELMEVLADGPRTATECAAATGESVASCSFHLRMLAKYGYIEPATRRGREKPWQVVSAGRDMRPSDDGDPDSVQALGVMAHVYVEREFDQIRSYVSAITREPIEWVQASTLFGSHTWATSDELAELSATIQRLTDRFDGRRGDPSLRPPGARPIRVFAAAHVDLAHERRS